MIALINRGRPEPDAEVHARGVGGGPAWLWAHANPLDASFTPDFDQVAGLLATLAWLAALSRWPSPARHQRV